MRVVLEASLDHFTAGELLTLLGAHGRAGTLEAASADRHARIFFTGGKVIWAESGFHMTPAAVVIDVAGWGNGTFRVLDAVALPEGVTAVALEVAPLVAEGVRRASEEKRLLELYPSDDVVFHVIQQPRADGGEMISLRPDEFQILFQIGSGRSLTQLRSESQKPPLELYRTLQRLQSAGLLSATGTDGATVVTRIDMRPPSESGAAPVAAPPPVTRPTRKTKVGEPRPKTIAQAKPLIATLTTETGTMHPLLEEETTIGRDDRNSIQVPHGSVSSRHARVIRGADGFTIEDLGSRNGTFVNSDLVTERRPLADNDIIRLGKVLLTFNLARDTKPRDTTKPEYLP